MSAAERAARLKAEVRSFYDSVGWTEIGPGLYQNARYEDLRPVTREYIQRCHRRVARHVPASGRFLLDAGSGPIQYPEYLEYSRGYRYRVCLDLSRRALVEARRRVGSHGLYVVGDLAALPFRAHGFEGVVSLHALHHLPPDEQETALRETARVTAEDGTAVVVYAWGDRSGLMAAFRPLIALASVLLRVYRGVRRLSPEAAVGAQALRAPGSHSFKHDFRWMTAALERLGGGEIRVWRSVSTAFTRALIHRPLFGGALLRLIYALEEAAPRWFGRHGMYPLIIVPGRRPASGGRA